MSRLLELAQIVDRLRDPGGCPWDRAQTLPSMGPYLLEEAYEVLDAIEAEDNDLLREELGDLLFVVLLLIRIGTDQGDLNLDEVAGGIAEKMVERHPHVFDPDSCDETDPGGIAAWEARKAKDPKKAARSRLGGVPRSLPSLLRAHRQAEKAAAVGFDWPDAASVLAKVEEEIGELREAMTSGDPHAITHEYGDTLMALANLGRHIDRPPEDALRAANNRFARRFADMEATAEARGLELSALDAAALDELWEMAKTNETDGT